MIKDFKNWKEKEKYIKAQQEYGFKTYTLPSINRFPLISGFDFTSNEYWLSNHNKATSHVNFKISNKRLVEHFTEKDKFISMKQYKHTKIRIIDIDQISQQYKVSTKEIAKKLIELIGEPFYLEYNFHSKGYHLYYEFKEYITDECLDRLKNLLFESYGYIIEPIKSNQHIRLPYSFNYKNAGIFNPEKKYLIEKVKYFSDVEKIFQNRKQIMINALLKKLNIKGVPAKAIRKSNYEKISNDLYYGNGTRHKFQPIIAYKTIRAGKTFEDFEYLCHFYNDGTSKDMKKPESSVKGLLTSIWKCALKNYNAEYFPEFEYTSNSENKELLNNVEYYLNNDEYKMLESYLNNMYIKHNEGLIDGIGQKKFIDGCLTLIEFLKNKKIYNRQTKYKYKQINLQPFNDGFLLNKDLKTLIGKSLGISNISRITKFLEKCKILKPIKTKSGHLYSYKGLRYGKHFLLINIFNLLNSINYIKTNYNKQYNTLFFNIKLLNPSTLFYNICEDKNELSIIQAIKEMKINEQTLYDVCLN